MKKILFTILGLGFMVNVMANIKFNDPNKSIEITQATPNFSITVQSNRTTGYMWLLNKYDTNLIKPLSQKYYAPKKSMPGAGGYEVWKFKVKPLGFVVPQVIKLTLIYARPWDLSHGKASVFKVVTRREDY